MTNAAALPRLDWEEDNTAGLPEYGLSFHVDDEYGEDPYHGFYWHEMTTNKGVEGFDTPEDAKRAAEEFVRTECVRTAFLVEGPEEHPGLYLLHHRHLPLYHENDEIHNGEDLVEHLINQGHPPLRFEKDAEARRHAEGNGLILKDPCDYGLV